MSMHRTEIRLVVTYSKKLSEMKYVPYCTLLSLYLFIKNVRRAMSCLCPVVVKEPAMEHKVFSLPVVL
jgi:hypothetical protein